MTEYTATRDFELTDGRHCFAYGKVRYFFTVEPGRKAVGWSDTMGGNYSPAEKPKVNVTFTEWSEGKSDLWTPAVDHLGDMLAEVPDAWFLEQAREQDE